MWGVLSLKNLFHFVTPHIVSCFDGEEVKIDVSGGKKKKLLPRICFLFRVGSKKGTENKVKLSIDRNSPPPVKHQKATRRWQFVFQ